MPSDPYILVLSRGRHAVGCIQKIEATGAKSGFLLIRVGNDELFDK